MAHGESNVAIAELVNGRPELVGASAVVELELPHAESTRKRAACIARVVIRELLLGLRREPPLRLRPLK
jgi:hypothetical protein